MRDSESEFRSILEQVETGMERVAAILEVYYNALKETGLPPALVERLIVEFQNEWARYTLNSSRKADESSNG